MVAGSQISLSYDRLSLREAVTLADVSEDRVKKDIERGWLKPMRVANGGTIRLLMEWHDVFSLAAIYHGNVLTSKAKSKFFSHWNQASKNLVTDMPTAGSTSRIYLNQLESSKYKLNIDDFIVMDMKAVYDKIAPRVKNYALGLSRIESRDDVLGGELVFKGSRLPVKHVGGLLNKGESIEHVIEDYPYLTENDAHFARMYVIAHPPAGRPRLVDGTADVDTVFPRRDDVSELGRSALGNRD